MTTTHDAERKLRSLLVAAVEVAADIEACRLFQEAASAHGTTIITAGDLHDRIAGALTRLLRERSFTTHEGDGFHEVGPR